MTGGASLPTALLALVAVIALILAGQFLVRRFAGGLPARLARPGRRLALEESLALDPRRRLHLVRCDGRSLLLLTGGAGGDAVVGWTEARGDAP